MRPCLAAGRHVLALRLRPSNRAVRRVRHPLRTSVPAFRRVLAVVCGWAGRRVLAGACSWAGRRVLAGACGWAGRRVLAGACSWAGRRVPAGACSWAGRRVLAGWFGPSVPGCSPRSGSCVLLWQLGDVVAGRTCQDAPQLPMCRGAVFGRRLRRSLGGKGAGLAAIPPNCGPVDDAERGAAVVGILDGASGRLVASWAFRLVESVNQDGQGMGHGLHRCARHRSIRLSTHHQRGHGTQCGCRASRWSVHAFPAANPDGHHRCDGVHEPDSHHFHDEHHDRRPALEQRADHRPRHPPRRP